MIITNSAFGAYFGARGSSLKALQTGSQLFAAASTLSPSCTKAEGASHTFSEPGVQAGFGALLVSSAIDCQPKPDTLPPHPKAKSGC